jgi:hypothetical protein
MRFPQLSRRGDQMNVSSFVLERIEDAADIAASVVDESNHVARQ